MKLSLHWPLAQPVAITQGFGGNGEYYRKNGIQVEGHTGLDLLAYHGQPVYASHSGYASYIVDKLGGHQISIRSDYKATMFGKDTYFKTIYVHLVDPKQDKAYQPRIPTDGSEVYVTAGQLIAFADNTGFSTGDHLHFSVKPIAKNAKGWYNTRQDNGYRGAVDPSFYMTKDSDHDRNATMVQKTLLHMHLMDKKNRKLFVENMKVAIDAQLAKLG